MNESTTTCSEGVGAAPSASFPLIPVVRGLAASNINSADSSGPGDWAGFFQRGIKPAVIDHLTWRLVAILGALISTSALTGASLYEESVLDLVWPRKPEIVRPIEGGANRKLFWIPADLIAIVSLLGATFAAWPVSHTRSAVLVGVGLYGINIAVSAAYFVPELLKVERNGTQPDDPSSRTWVRRNRWRGAILICTTVALGLAVATMVAVS